MTELHSPKDPPRSLRDIAMLAEAFGKSRVVVHTEYHVTIRAAKGDGKHDVWFASQGLKYRLAGNRHAKCAANLQSIIAAITAVDGGHAKSDLHHYREASQYIFRGNKGDVTKQIGNAVCPDVAAAITTCLAGAA